MATEAWTKHGRRLDARRFSDHGWNRLCHRVRKGLMVLHCENCQTPLRPRHAAELLGRRRHFFHVAGIPRSCANTDQENESDAHKDIKGVLVDAYRTVSGLVVETEYNLVDADGKRIRVDVAAHKGLEIASLAEVQLEAKPLDVIQERNAQRRSALQLNGQGFVVGATPWFATRAIASHYHKFPWLYLSQDGQRITDGIYEPHPYGGPDLDKPVELDIDAFCHAQINHQFDVIDDEGAWIDRRKLQPGQKLKRGQKRRPQWKPLRNIECSRPAVTLAGHEAPPPAELATKGGARTHILATSMAGKWERPPLQPWQVELVGGPYRGCVIAAWKLGPHVDVIGEHGRVRYTRCHYDLDGSPAYTFDRII